MAASIFYVRHAESTWNAVGRWQGQSDPPLSARGREQAVALAERLAAHPRARELALLATSPLRRAHQTAAALAERIGLEPRPVEALRELDAGCWSGLTRAQVADRFPEELERFLCGDDELRAGGGESRAMLRRRVLAGLRALAAEAAGRPFAVVAHLGTRISLVPGARLPNAELLALPPSVVDAAAPSGPLEGDVL